MSRPKGWYRKHPRWLKMSCGRCTVTLLKIGKHRKTNYRPYHMQHLHYKNWNREKYWWDVLPMNAKVEQLIHWSGGAKTVRQQNKQARNFGKFLGAILSYPNPIQYAIHVWARVIALGLLLVYYRWQIFLVVCFLIIGISLYLNN